MRTVSTSIDRATDVGANPADPEPPSARATVRFWAGARHRAGHSEEPTQAATIGALREQLLGPDRLGELATVAAFLVDGSQAGDNTAIPAGAIVDVLPPFAGG